MPIADPTVTPYLDWARNRLPDHLPAEAIEHGLRLRGHVEGLSLMVWPFDDDPDEFYAIEAPDEDALRREIFQCVCRRIAAWVCRAPEAEAREKARWRYVADPSLGRSSTGESHVRENPRYEFNAIYMPVKAEQELLIYLLRNPLPEPELRKLVRGGQNLLNSGFPDAHWGFDWQSYTYREVSDSHEKSLPQRLPEPPAAPVTAETVDAALDATVLPHARWILHHLPADVTAEEGRKAVLCLRDGRVQGTSYWRQGEDSPSFTAKDEEELRRRLYSEVCYWIAVSREPAHREQERARYRYEWRTVRQNGRVVRFPPQERENWEYDATFDHRKWWMEEHLRLIRDVAAKDELAATAESYQGQLNVKYPDRHWVWNRWEQGFIEASRSKQKGIEDALAGRRPEPWQPPKEKKFFVLRSFVRFVRQWFLGL